MKRSQRRDKLIIINDILSILSRKGPLRKTRLMHLANLNPQSFARRIGELKELGLLEQLCRDNKCLYTITRKGSFMLSLLRVLQHSLNLSSETIYEKNNIRTEIAKTARSIGLEPSLSGIVTGSTGTSYIHDIVLTTKNKELLVINTMLYDQPSTIRQYELGAIMASCIDTQVPHIIVVPPSFEGYYTTLFSKLRDGCKTIIIVWRRDPLAPILEKLAERKPVAKH